MQLMELPDELLTQIVNHIGGQELRKNINNLTISRRWYEIALPMFLAGLKVSRIKLNATSFSKFPTAETSPLLQLISCETQGLTLRLLGHYWDSGTSRDHDAWNASDTSSTDNSDDEAENEPEVSEAELKAPTQSSSLLAWRKATNTTLLALSRSIANFTALTTLRLEFAAESEAHLGPLWNYLSRSTLTSLLTHLPLHHALTDLTIDLCGTSVGAAAETHTCRLIANLLPYLSRLRVRTRSMCPAILALPTTTSPNLSVVILKLHQPFWQQLSGRSNAETYCTRHCADACERNKLHGVMYAAARKALPQLGTRLRVFRISYADVWMRGTGVGVIGVDVLAGLKIGVPEEFFVYEDDGRPCWWEEGSRRYGPFVH